MLCTNYITIRIATTKVWRKPIDNRNLQVVNSTIVLTAKRGCDTVKPIGNHETTLR